MSCRLINFTQNLLILLFVFCMFIFWCLYCSNFCIHIVNISVSIFLSIFYLSPYNILIFCLQDWVANGSCESLKILKSFFLLSSFLEEKKKIFKEGTQHAPNYENEVAKHTLMLSLCHNECPIMILGSLCATLIKTARSNGQIPFEYSSQ